MGLIKGAASRLVGGKAGKIRTTIGTWILVKMATHLIADKARIEAARSQGGLKTGKPEVPQPAVKTAQKSQPSQIVSLFNCIDYDINYDYKAQRRRMRHGAAGSI